MTIGSVFQHHGWAHTSVSAASLRKNSRPIHDSKNGHMQGSWEHLSEESVDHFVTIGSIFQQQKWADAGASEAFSGKIVGSFVTTRGIL